MYPILGDTVSQCSKSFTPVVLLTAGKHHSVASTEAKPDIINKNLSFRWAYDSPYEQQSRPLILIYSWLVAKARHMHKYGDFYLKKGWDVLHVKVDPLQLMLPSSAQRVVGQVLEFTQDDKRLKQPILVHGFSVGGYLWGETLVKILSDESLIANLRHRIHGQIMDSPVSFHGIPFGVSQAVTDVRLLQNIVEGTISSYLSLTKNITMKYYVRSQETFEENVMHTPSMFLFSKADVIGRHRVIEECIEKMKRKGIAVYSKCWEDSRHVSHFQRHPVEYIDMMTYFLQRIKFLDVPDEGKIQMTG
ncbi:hypothetical protein LSH36_934g02020 [Paralvinella palmiformis]|uniref:Uncharacterized protein n=1 Tax=Paralvinella palmiformis TaxID=53620 RepID=A0AAD9IXV7_9ANNE|nr:hypothetical protein LSH36_934g02020 [Paralvinella palmiformis]